MEQHGTLRWIKRTFWAAFLAAVATVARDGIEMVRRNDMELRVIMDEARIKVLEDARTDQRARNLAQDKFNELVIQNANKSTAVHGR